MNPGIRYKKNTQKNNTQNKYTQSMEIKYPYKLF